MKKGSRTRLIISRELQKIVGKTARDRVTLTKQLWDYIGQHKLADWTARPITVLPDRQLGVVLGSRKRIDVETLTDLVGKHIRGGPIEVSHRSPPSKGDPTRGATNEINHWVWVTQPKFYENEAGSSAVRVGPSEGWWTCSPQTRSGDFVLLYRAKKRKDFAFLIVATTDAFRIDEDPLAEAHGWRWACEYDVLYELKDPVPLSALRSNKAFWDWHALKMNLQGRAFEVPNAVWDSLTRLALASNPGLAPFVGQKAERAAPKRIIAERHLEDELARNLSALRGTGWNLKVWKDPSSGRSGRQFVCAAAGGRIDLLCTDQKTGAFVVVELKNVMASEETFMQTWRYLSWVREYLAKDAPVFGLVVARGCDSRFELMARATDGKVRFLSVADAGFR